ncbi:MAG: tyrosine-type recombinase/integrase [Nitrospinota bacterium]|nr:tyrosine-type recombinase/integrase [Nitrospinota bacterium]
MHKVQKSELKFITENEFKLIFSSAKDTRQPIRNQLIIMMLYRHGLRESELINITMDNLILDQSKIKINRIKGGVSNVHPMEGDELRLMKRYLRERDSSLKWLFLSEQKTQMHRNSIAYIVKSCVNLAKLDKNISPHMLRHGCGYHLVNKNVNLRVIQDYLGHKDIKNTARYTSLDSGKFEGLFG